MKKTIVSMILVGGKGSRLKEITKDTAKPAVSFGAKYRLIDFTLSNLTNSNIDVVGVVTQYEPYDLMSYIGSGASWDLDVVDGGIHFLTPFAKNGDVLWQQGTAHAIRQYFSFVKEYQANYVLILSGDQIYKMDYQKMLEHHLNHNADITIACTNVEKEEASRFGIVTIDESDRVLGFEEKPSHPKSTLASMGLYLFNTEVLEKLLIKDKSNEVIDFGKNILPKSISQGDIVSAYTFHGYWKDVGTIESLFHANMDLVESPDFLTLNTSRNLPIYSKSLNLPPHIILSHGDVKQSIIADGCLIDGKVTKSVVGYECVMKRGSQIDHSVIMPNAVINEFVFLRNVIVNKGLEIPKNYRLDSEEVVLLDFDNIEKLGEIHE